VKSEGRRSEEIRVKSEGRRSEEIRVKRGRIK
jgi:hypothetical protein